MNANQPTAPGLDARVVCESNDLATVEKLYALRGQQAGEPLTALFIDDAVAKLFTAESGVRALAWGPVLGQLLADELPQRPPQRVAPPLTLIGDQQLLEFVAAAYVQAGAQPGQSLPINCIGAQPDWAQVVNETYSGLVTMTWASLPMRPIPVARRVAELVEMWDAPKAKHATPTGPTAIVALAPEDQAVAIGAAIARGVRDARVAVVVRDAGIWPAPEGVRLVSVADAQERALAGVADPTERLTQLLLGDTAWLSAPDAEVTRPVVPLLAEVARDSAGEPLALEEQPGLLRAQLEAVARNAERILATGDLVVLDSPTDGRDVILTPSELAAIADELLAVLRFTAEPGVRLTACELAFRLPALLMRSGRSVGRPAGYQPMLTSEKVATLAPLVHLAYQGISVQTGNATDSPLAYEMWGQLTEFYRASNRAVLAGCVVAHAAAGLGWRPVSSAGSVSLSADEIEVLAELEHRRWAIHQRRNGAGNHDWMKPWSEIAEDVKDYDRHIMSAMIGILADGGIEVYRETGEQ